VEELLGENPIVINEAKEEIKAEVLSMRSRKSPLLLMRPKKKLKLKKSPLLSMRSMKSPLLLMRPKKKLRLKKSPFLRKKLRPKSLLLRNNPK